jgi:ankyrin repeat protein
MEGKHEFNISKMLKTFDGTAQAWPDFRKTLCKVLTVQEMLYIIERADDELESVQGSTIKVEGSSSSDLDDDDAPDELLLADPRVDPAVDDNGPVMRAASCGHLKIVELLLADPRVDPSVAGIEAIDTAAMYGQLEVVKRLLTDSRVDRASWSDRVRQLAVSWNGHVNGMKVLHTNDGSN